MTGSQRDGVADSGQLTYGRTSLLAALLLPLYEGVPKEWVRASERKLQLNPGAQGSILLTITAPRLPSSRAGEHNFVLRVRPDEDRQVSEWKRFGARCSRSMKQA